MTATIDIATVTNNAMGKRTSHEEALEIANTFVERDMSESIRDFARECAEYERERNQVNGQSGTGK